MFCLSFLNSRAQSGTISGTVRDKNTQESLIGAIISIEEAGLKEVSDSLGGFRINNIPPKAYTIKVNLPGYQDYIMYDVNISSGNTMIVNIDLAPQVLELKTVTVKSNPFVKSKETPLSSQSLTAQEIRSNPGGNFDISNVIQSLPGVGGTASTVGGFRNDIIIRGGAPNENIYYLDGIEVPVINHFSTQGSAGGPTGMLNISFIEDVTLNSSSFHARYDNALSSVLQFRQRDGNPDKVQGNIRMGSTELASTLEGPAGKKTTFLVSARRSYLQLLFKALDIPILPSYWDFQYKVTTKIDNKTTLSAIGLGAIDDFRFTTPRNPSPENYYIVSNQPIIKQWNYTTGFALKRLIKKGYFNIALSRNMYNNRIFKYQDNENNVESKKRYDLSSQEIENKLRFDFNHFYGKWKFSYGGGLQYVKYANQTFNRLQYEIKDAAGNIIQPDITLDFKSGIEFYKTGLFSQISRSVLKDRLNLSFGLRTDANTFTTEGTNLLKTLSPRGSFSYSITNRFNWNGSAGKYFKIPPYTILGFRNNQDELVNKNNNYTSCIHYVTGFEYIPRNSTRITLEGFYKLYNNYPVSARDGISLANTGGDFNVYGNEKVLGIGKGRAYGAEFFFQQKLTKRLFAVFSYTLFRTEFTGINTEKFISSSWDNRQLLSFIGGWKIGRNWELGVKFRYQGGSPFTPFNTEASQKNFLTTGSAILDYSRLNTNRLPDFNSLDMRIDKKYNFKHTSLDLFLDYTNVYQAKNYSLPDYIFKRKADNSGFLTTDGKEPNKDGSNCIPEILTDKSSVSYPTIGFIFEF